MKDFRSKIKEKTRKTLTLNKEEWLRRVNPIIRGKVNYFLNIYKAIKENKEEQGQKSRCVLRWMRRKFQDLDVYIRKRLSVAFIHKHPSQRKGMKMNSKWNNSFFAKIGLISTYWLYLHKTLGYSLEQYIEDIQKNSKEKQRRTKERHKRKGKEYHTPRRLEKMQNAWNASS